MKTNNYNLRQISLYSLLGILGLAVTSCSSYQNTSSYDNDGIYGSVPHDENDEPIYTYNNGNVTEYRDGDVSGQNMNYKAYFSSLQNEYPATAFTDVEEYSSYNDDDVAPQENISYTSYSSNSYPAWGEATDNVTVNVYGGYNGWNNWNNWYSPYWGWGWGWNNGWYGSGWNVGIGWGYGNWGWGLGWNNWHTPYYGGYYGY